MSRVPGSTKLTELCIPGTHDSGSYSGDPGPIFRCQNMDIAAQLEAGIRYLDIRCVPALDGFDIYHAYTDLHLKFETVQQACVAFLQTHPSETIVMHIKQEGDGPASARSFDEIFAAQRQLHRDYWYQGSNVPTLDQARGKIVLLRRYFGSEIGINPISWNDNDWTLTRNAANGEFIVIQDVYKTYFDLTNNAMNPDSKFEMVRKMLLDSVFATDNNTLYINYASGSAGINPVDVANGVASYRGVNVCLNDFLAGTLGYRAKGIVAMDFPEAQGGLIANLIAVNFLPRYTPPAVVGRRVQILPLPANNEVKWEVEDSGKSEGSAIQLWDTNGSQTYWFIEPVIGTNEVRIKNIDSGLYLGATTDADNGVKCVLRRSDHVTTQYYLLPSPAGSGQYMLWNSRGKLGVPVERENANLGNSTKIQFWNSGLDRTRWTLRPA